VWRYSYKGANNVLFFTSTFVYSATILQTDTKRKPQVVCISCSRLKSNARLLHHLIEISDLYQTGGLGWLHAQLHSTLFRLQVFIKSVLVFGSRFEQSLRKDVRASITVLRRWRGTIFNLCYTTTCFIKPEDGLEKISRNVVIIPKELQHTLRLLVHVWMKTC